MWLEQGDLYATSWILVDSLWRCVCEPFYMPGTFGCHQKNCNAIMEAYLLQRCAGLFLKCYFILVYFGFLLQSNSVPSALQLAFLYFVSVFRLY